MKIDRITVRYGELRSTGYPSFSNTRHEIEISGEIGIGETGEEVRLKLLAIARESVRVEFEKNTPNASPLGCLPFWLRSNMPEHAMNVVH